MWNVNIHVTRSNLSSSDIVDSIVTEFIVDSCAEIARVQTRSSALQTDPRHARAPALASEPIEERTHIKKRFCVAFSVP